MLDIGIQGEGRPVILYLTSKGYESGPKNDARQPVNAHAEFYALWADGDAVGIQPLCRAGMKGEFMPTRRRPLPAC